MNIQFDPFIVEYDPITTPVEDFKAECITAANKVISHNVGNLPVVVLMSGGIDSELVGEALLLAKIPFKCVIGKLQTDLVNESLIFNSHDYQFAERWCVKNSIEIIYCGLDIFKQNKLLCEYALSANSFSPQFACHMYIMKWCSDNGYFFLAGHGEPDIVLRNNEYYMKDEQRAQTVNNFCKLYNLTGKFQFWKQDGRLISAFLQLPTVKSLMAQGVVALSEHKHTCFSDIFQFEGRNKATGFERLQEWDYQLRNYLKKYNGKYDKMFYTPITQFI